MTENQKSKILNALGAEFQENLGNRITAALANGIMHAVISAMNQADSDEQQAGAGDGRNDG